MTESRCTVCRRLDRIAELIEKKEESLFVLDPKLVDRIYKLATGQ